MYLKLISMWCVNRVKSTEKWIPDEGGEGVEQQLGRSTQIYSYNTPKG